TVVEEMDVRPGGTYRFNTAFGVVEGEFREVDPPERLVQTFQNHLQTLEFEDLGEQTRLTQTMRFETTEQRDTTMQYGVEGGAKRRIGPRGSAVIRACRRVPLVVSKSSTMSSKSTILERARKVTRRGGRTRPARARRGLRGCSGRRKLSRGRLGLRLSFLRSSHRETSLARCADRRDSRRHLRSSAR